MKLFARADPAHADDNRSDVERLAPSKTWRTRSTAPTVVEITPTTDTPTTVTTRGSSPLCATTTVVLVAGALLCSSPEATNETQPAVRSLRAVRGASATTTARSGPRSWQRPTEQARQ